MGYACAHLHGGAFAAEREACTDCEQPAEELHRDQTKRCVRQFFAKHGLDMRDAAGGSMGREFAHQPGSEGGCGGARENDEQNTIMLAVRQGDCGIAQTVGLGQRQAEQPSHKPRGGADDQRQQRERQQAAGLLCGFRWPFGGFVHRGAGSVGSRS
jgi:hypothetical protein